jgi:hypothetical protein
MGTNVHRLQIIGFIGDEAGKTESESPKALGSPPLPGSKDHFETHGFEPHRFCPASAPRRRRGRCRSGRHWPIGCARSRRRRALPPAMPPRHRPPEAVKRPALAARSGMEKGQGEAQSPAGSQRRLPSPAPPPPARPAPCRSAARANAGSASSGMNALVFIGDEAGMASRGCTGPQAIEFRRGARNVGDKVGVLVSFRVARVQ